MQSGIRSDGWPPLLDRGLSALNKRKQVKP